MKPKKEDYTVDYCNTSMINHARYEQALENDYDVLERELTRKDKMIDLLCEKLAENSICTKECIREKVEKECKE